MIKTPTSLDLQGLNNIRMESLIAAIDEFNSKSFLDNDLNIIMLKKLKGLTGTNKLVLAAAFIEGMNAVRYIAQDCNEHDCWQKAKFIDDIDRNKLLSQRAVSIYQRLQLRDAKFANVVLNEQELDIVNQIVQCIKTDIFPTIKPHITEPVNNFTGMSKKECILAAVKNGGTKPEMVRYALHMYKNGVYTTQDYASLNTAMSTVIYILIELGYMSGTDTKPEFFKLHELVRDDGGKP